MKDRQGTETRKRQNILAVRLTDAERAELDGKADAHGMTAAAFVRTVALGHQVKDRDADKIVAALSRVGNNLNQLAKEANAGRFPGEGRIGYALDELTKIIKEL